MSYNLKQQSNNTINKYITPFSSSFLTQRIQPMREQPYYQPSRSTLPLNNQMHPTIKQQAPRPLFAGLGPSPMLPKDDRMTKSFVERQQKKPYDRNSQKNLSTTTGKQKCIQILDDDQEQQAIKQNQVNAAQKRNKQNLKNKQIPIQKLSSPYNLKIDNNISNNNINNNNFLNYPNQQKYLNSQINKSYYPQNNFYPYNLLNTPNSGYLPKQYLLNNRNDLLYTNGKYLENSARANIPKPFMPVDYSSMNYMMYPNNQYQNYYRSMLNYPSNNNNIYQDDNNNNNNKLKYLYNNNNNTINTTNNSINNNTNRNINNYNNNHNTHQLNNNNLNNINNINNQNTNTNVNNNINLSSYISQQQQINHYPKPYQQQQNPSSNIQKNKQIPIQTPIIQQKHQKINTSLIQNINKNLIQNNKPQQLQTSTINNSQINIQKKDKKNANKHTEVIQLLSSDQEQQDDQKRQQIKGKQMNYQGNNNNINKMMMVGNNNSKGIMSNNMMMNNNSQQGNMMSNNNNGPIGSNNSFYYTNTNSNTNTNRNASYPSFTHSNNNAANYNNSYHSNTNNNNMYPSSSTLNSNRLTNSSSTFPSSKQYKDTDYSSHNHLQKTKQIYKPPHNQKVLKDNKIDYLKQKLQDLQKMKQCRKIQQDMTNSLSVHQKNSLLENSLYPNNNYLSNPQGFSYLNQSKLAASLSDPSMITFKNPNPLLNNNPSTNNKSAFQKPSYLTNQMLLNLTKSATVPNSKQNNQLRSIQEMKYLEQYYKINGRQQPEFSLNHHPSSQSSFQVYNKQKKNNSNNNNNNSKSFTHSYLDPNIPLSAFNKPSAPGFMYPSSSNNNANNNNTNSIIDQQKLLNKQISGSQHVRKQAQKAYLKSRTRQINSSNNSTNMGNNNSSIVGMSSPSGLGQLVTSGNGSSFQKYNPATSNLQSQSQQGLGIMDKKRSFTTAGNQKNKKQSINDGYSSTNNQSTSISANNNDKSNKTSSNLKNQMQQKSFAASFQWTPKLKKLRELIKKRQNDSVIMIGPEFQAQLPNFINDQQNAKNIVAIKRANLLKRLYTCSN